MPGYTYKSAYYRKTCLKKLFDNEMQLLKTCAAMETHGVLLNRPYVEASLVYERKQIEQSKKDFETDTGRAYKSSSKLFAEILTERGVVVPTTSKGNSSVTGDFLDHCSAPIAERIKAVRYHEKRASTYFVNFLYYMDKDNKIHPNMNQAGTATGRFSYSKPNLQNIPKDKIDNITNVRRAFIPPPEHRLLSIDYSQQEYRIMLDYAGQHDMIAAINDGADVHQVTADKLKVSRTAAKTLNFAILYGTGNANLAHMLSCTLTQAKNIKLRYFRELPAVAKLIRQVKQTGETRGYIKNKYGRRYWCSDYKFSYKLPNYLIQGTGADVIKHAMVKIDAYLQDKRSKMVLQVHDELLLYLHKDEEHIVEDIEQIMMEAYIPMNKMGLTVDRGLSDLSWGDIA